MTDKIIQQINIIREILEGEGIDFSMYNPKQRADLINSFLLGRRFELQDSLPMKLSKLKDELIR